MASILAEALNGYATRRFQSQTEVKRFLETQPEFPKHYRGTEVSLDRVKQMLTNLLYAGYIERPERGVPLTKAFHDPLISYDTYLIIQDRLNSASVAPARKDINLEFPLRGFVTCASCGHSLTACWSRSGTGRQYPYYLCQYRACPEKGKSVGREKLEFQFEALLRSLQPDPATLKLAEAVFIDAWARRETWAKQEIGKLRQRLSQLEKDSSNILSRAAQTQIDVIAAAYEAKALELASERARVESQIRGISFPDRSFDEMFELAMKLLSNPYEIWKKANTTLKKVILRLVFTRPMEFSRKSGVRTAETTLPFKALRYLEGGDFKMVPGGGIMSSE